MAATNYTPIQLYRTTTASAVPSAGNLAAGELAINLTDEKLYFKNAGGTVTLLASSASASNVGTVTSVAASGGTTGLTFSGSPITSSGTLTLGGTLAVANGGTGATSLTSGYLVKGNGTSAASASVVYDDGTNVGIGTSSPGVRLDVQAAAAAQKITSTTGTNQVTLTLNNTGGNFFIGRENSAGGFFGTTAYASVLRSDGAYPMVFFTDATERARITPVGYLEATYSDKVVALGNTGTATTIDLTQGNVFTATLTGNCTFTLSNPNANSGRGSSFTLILTNDGTAGRTVAWSGGSFRFPGGAASLSRTTTANAVDIWVFFTPDNGTTWYGNISMKNMAA